MKYINRLLVGILLPVLLLTGCQQSQAGAVKTLPEYNEFAPLIGQSKDAIIAELALSEGDLAETALEMYTTPFDVKYSDVSFDVVLGFNVYEGLLNAVRYQAAYDNAPETAAASIVKVSKSLEKLMGEEDAGDDFSVWGLSEKELLDKLAEEKNFHACAYWDITGDAAESQTSYIAYLEDADSWDMYGTRKPTYYLVMEISELDEAGTIYLSVYYGVYPERLTA